MPAANWQSRCKRSSARPFEARNKPRSRASSSAWFSGLSSTASAPACSAANRNAGLPGGTTINTGKCRLWGVARSFWHKSAPDISAKAWATTTTEAE